uniref:ADP-ribosylation factor-like protein 16 n=1 Tax=Geotrypetes seraphini TaxID=260995 RepID=A0A6P8SH98_GEOSA|nr:ADP-ribosylation factor-like protein 16 [Geotrypetes seraphini]
MCLLLGAAGTGKTLLVKRLQKLGSSDDGGDLGDVPPTLSTVGTNLTDLVIQKRTITVRELGGCMGPIWPSYYRDCSSVMFVIDAANPRQISASCIQLLSVLSADTLATASVLILFNKIDLSGCMSLLELKSLFRLNDIISCAKQAITVLEVSARDGTGLPAVLQWLYTVYKD